MLPAEKLKDVSQDYFHPEKGYCPNNSLKTAQCSGTRQIKKYYKKQEDHKKHCHCKFILLPFLHYRVEVLKDFLKDVLKDLIDTPHNSTMLIEAAWVMRDLQGLLHKEKT